MFFARCLRRRATSDIVALRSCEGRVRQRALGMKRSSFTSAQATWQRKLRATGGPRRSARSIAIEFALARFDPRIAKARAKSGQPSQLVAVFRCRVIARRVESLRRVTRRLPKQHDRDAPLIAPFASKPEFAETDRWGPLASRQAVFLTDALAPQMVTAEQRSNGTAGHIAECVDVRFEFGFVVLVQAMFAASVNSCLRLKIACFKPEVKTVILTAIDDATVLKEHVLLTQHIGGMTLFWKNLPPNRGD